MSDGKAIVERKAADSMQVVPTSTAKGGHPDWFRTFSKFFIYGAWGLLLLTQTESTELLFAHMNMTINIFQPDISVIWQIPGIFFDWNKIPSSAVFVAWIIEIIYLNSLMRLKAMLARANASHPKHANVLLTFLVACIAINLVTDYMFGPVFDPGTGNAIVGHLVYVFFAEIVIIYGPIIAESI